MVAQPDAGKTLGPLCPICTEPYTDYTKLKWTYPKPTKSGRDVIEIWNDLKHAWSSYKIYRLYNDKINMVIKAKLIRRLQADLGMSQEKFTELHGVFSNE